MYYSFALAGHIEAHAYAHYTSLLCLLCFCARGRIYDMPPPLGAPHAAAQFHPIHALRLGHPARLEPWIPYSLSTGSGALSGYDYGVVHINYVVTWTANQSGLVTWPFDLESGVWVTSDVGYLCANFSLPTGLSVLALRGYIRPMYATDVRQTDVRRT